jgi:hypothetical protein
MDDCERQEVYVRDLAAPLNQFQREQFVVQERDAICPKFVVW